jgi:hypothetical protein
MPWSCDATSYRFAREIEPPVSGGVTAAIARLRVREVTLQA